MQFTPLTQFDLSSKNPPNRARTIFTCHSSIAVQRKLGKDGVKGILEDLKFYFSIGSKGLEEILKVPRLAISINFLGLP